VNGSFDEPEHERPSPRLFARTVIQGKCRRASMHSGTSRRSHIGMQRGRTSVVRCGEFCVDGSLESLYKIVIDGIQPDCTSVLVGDMRSSMAGARSAIVLLAQRGASCMCFDS
jgi:hypothetical protein